MGPCFKLTLLALAGAVSHVQALKAAPKDINPPLKDVSSDKKFFGPNGDYGQDTRPVVQKSVMDKLKGPGQPYPALQSKHDYDSDYVKDENADTGAWQAQFEYDALRKKLAQKEGDKKRAEARASKEGSEADKAKAEADAANKKVDDASKDANDAAKGEGDADKADADAVAPSAEALEKLKKQVAEAEEKHEKQKIAFEECKKQLEDAKAKVAELKQQTEAMEKQLASETKLWVEQKATKLNLKKARKSAADQLVASKTQAAQERLAKVTATKATLDAVLAKEKAEHEKAQLNLHKQTGELDQAKKDLEKAATKLQKMHGFKPDGAPSTKSGAATVSAVFSLSMVAVMQLF